MSSTLWGGDENATANLRSDGAVAQLVERFHGMEEVARSIRVSSTLTPSEIGARAESAVAAALVGAGYEVFVPVFSSHSRIDLVLIELGRLRGVQCKTSKLMNGTVVFYTCSNTGGIRKSYADDADLFGVYSPELHRVYLVPVCEAPERACTLRVEPTRNAQSKGIRWARDYEIRPLPRVGRSSDHS